MCAFIKHVVMITALLSALIVIVTNQTHSGSRLREVKVKRETAERPLRDFG